jgi:DNA-binding PadR family transcriptional regulator
MSTWEKSPRVWNLAKSKHTNRFGFDLKLTLILSLLREFTELTGYSLHKKIEEKSGVALSYGSIYPIMHMLINEGLVKSRIVPSARNGSIQKNVYSLTESGENQFDIALCFLKRLGLPATQSINNNAHAVIAPKSDV